MRLTYAVALAALAASPALADCAPATHSPRAPSDATTVTFENRTPDRDLSIWWVDHEGALELYSVLPPGSSYDQPTEAGHVWVGTDGGAGCAFIVIVRGKDKVVLE